MSNVKCHEMSNVMKCQMSWNADADAGSYHRPADGSPIVNQSPFLHEHDKSFPGCDDAFSVTEKCNNKREGLHRSCCQSREGDSTAIRLLQQDTRSQPHSPMFLWYKIPSPAKLEQLLPMWVIEPAGRINLGVDDQYDYNQHKDSVATLVSMLSMSLLQCYTDHWY